MSDMIYREDAIDVLEKLSACEEYGVEVGTDEETYIGKYEAIIEIRDLPSADRPQGEWVTEYNGTGWNDRWDYTCTNCKMKFPRADNVLQYAHYCPSCGARMKGADNE